MSTVKTVGGEAIGVILALIGTGIQMRWPEQKWIGSVFIVAGVAVAFGVFIWALAIRYARKQMTSAASTHTVPPVKQHLSQHAPIANTNNPVFAPVFAPNFHQSQTQDQSARSRTEIPIAPSPVLFKSTPRIERTKIDGYTFEIANLYAANSDPGGMDADVIFVKFTRNDESPESFLNTIASIEFLSPAEESLFKIDRAYWWKSERYHSQDSGFRIGDTGKLIVAIVGKSKVWPYSGEYITIRRIALTYIKQFILETKEHPLEEKQYVVRIELIGTVGGLVKFRKHFDYHLTLEPTREFKLIGDPEREPRAESSL